MLQSPFGSVETLFMEFSLVRSFFRKSFAASIFTVAFAVFAAGQNAGPSPTPKSTPAATPTPVVNAKDAIKNPTADQIAETTIFVIGGGGGRILLNQIRKTSLERGRVSVMNAEGKMEQASYQKFTTRGDTLAKERIRLDQEFPTASYSLVYADEKTFGIFKDQVFTPREDASRSFQNQIFFGLDTLLRYKENESKIELGGKDKIAGVDLHIVDVTDKQGRKSRFYISAKSFRIMMMSYEDQGIKYKRKYYDYNLAQGTLVPFRTVLYAGDKIVEETDIGTVTFGQKIEENTYASN
ncbi:MAG: hypothetical protein HOP17_09065 [Acidobacteria bacterium]|nr:hypothetical protein [Acidobacteriota bacterium]